MTAGQAVRLIKEHTMHFKRTVIWIMSACLAGLMPVMALAGNPEYVNPAVPGKDHPAFWLDRGGLCATYGNYTAAIEAFKQALKLDPANGEAYFDLALAYMGLDDYDLAVEHFNKALELSPQQGRFFYGRARALLVSGRKAQAMDDFQKAADLGNLDAADYLKK
jgi:tetratricopeptide (TPR) repeat protein